MSKTLSIDTLSIKQTEPVITTQELDSLMGVNLSFVVSSMAEYQQKILVQQSKIEDVLDQIRIFFADSSFIEITK